jgi:AcrR family transcriptional regulator
MASSMPVRKPAEARKAEIIAAALHLADELGPERLTTEAIADAVGLTQPGIFRHFPKKQDLWEAVAARIGAMMEALWAKARDPEAAPIDQLRAVVAAQLRLIQSTPAIPSILFSRELHTKNEVLRQAFFDLLRRFHGVVTEVAARAGEAGELRRDIDPEDVAFLVIGLVQGLAVRWSISGRSFGLAQEGSRLLDIQLSGLVRERAPSRKEAMS